MTHQRIFSTLLVVFAACRVVTAQQLPWCEVLPEANHEAVFLLGGKEATRWNFGNNYARPFLYPINGPSGVSLTRMGHPGAPDHDHHQSVWFAHHDVEGQSFWANGRGTSIRQKQWLVYEDSDTQATMACILGWVGQDGEELLEQELIVAMLPATEGQYELEIQSIFRPGKGREQVTLGKTNFGFLAVRVSKSISEHFGSGRLSSSEGHQTEKEIFGTSARWVDYSGPVHATVNGTRQMVTEGITFMDHHENPRHPTHWHVRADGWMGASFGMKESFSVTKDEPLKLRYSLWIHLDGGRPEAIEERYQAFQKRSAMVVQRSSKPHFRNEVVREDSQPNEE